MLVKEAMEKVMAQSGRSVKHYHADNGRFSDNGFVDAVNRKSQNLTFCGVGAHHQNCIIENKNKVLTTGARTLFLHGIIMWNQIIDNMFWPFLMKYVANQLNSLQVDILGRTPESILHGVEVQDIQVKSYHKLRAYKLLEVQACRNGNRVHKLGYTLGNHLSTSVAWH